MSILLQNTTNITMISTAVQAQFKSVMEIEKLELRVHFDKQNVHFGKAEDHNVANYREINASRVSENSNDVCITDGTRE